MVFGVGQFNTIIFIYPQLTLVAMASNGIWDKIGYNLACYLFVTFASGSYMIDVLFVYLSVGLIAGLHKKLQAELAEIFREHWTCHNLEVIDFDGAATWRMQKNNYTTLSEVCGLWMPI